MHMCTCLYSYNMCDCMRMRLSLLLLGYGFDCRTQTRTHPYTNIVIVIIIGWKWIELHGNGRNELQTTIIWRARMSGIISVVIFCHCYQCWEAALLSKCTEKWHETIRHYLRYNFLWLFYVLCFDDLITFQGCTDEISFLLYNELHQMSLKLLR